MSRLIASEPSSEALRRRTGDELEASISWLRDELHKGPMGDLYPDLVEPSTCAVKQWASRLDRKAFNRCLRQGHHGAARLLKELHELAPIISRLKRDIHMLSAGGATPITIVDLCSGFGYLSMMLSEILPAHCVLRIVLIDKCWPMSTQEAALPSQISIEHLRCPGWPIRLDTRQVDLKRSREVKQLVGFVFERASAAASPTVVLGVHLCGLLSVRAVQLFNTCTEARLLFLKPCCLPGKQLLTASRRAVRKGGPGVIWDFSSGHSFTPQEVYGVGVGSDGDAADDKGQGAGDGDCEAGDGEGDDKGQGAGDGEGDGKGQGAGDGDGGAGDGEGDDKGQGAGDGDGDGDGGAGGDGDGGGASDGDGQPASKCDALAESKREATRELKVEPKLSRRQLAAAQGKSKARRDATGTSKRTPHAVAPIGDGMEDPFVAECGMEDPFVAECGVCEPDDGSSHREPPRSQRSFEAWTRHLFLGVDVPEAHKVVESPPIKRGHFQNAYIIAERPPVSSVGQRVSHQHGSRDLGPVSLD